MKKVVCIDGINAPHEVKFDKIPNCNAESFLHGLAEQWESQNYEVKWLSNTSFTVVALYITYSII